MGARIQAGVRRRLVAADAFSQLTLVAPLLLLTTALSLLLQMVVALIKQLLLLAQGVWQMVKF